MRISFQLTLAFALVASLIGAVGYIWSEAAQEVSAGINQVGHKSLAETMHASRLLATTQNIYLRAAELVGTTTTGTDENDRPGRIANIKRLQQLILDDLKVLQDSQREIRTVYSTFTNTIRSTSDAAALESLIQHRREWLEPLDESLAAHADLLERLVHRCLETPAIGRDFFDNSYLPFHDKVLSPFLRAYLENNEG